MTKLPWQSNYAPAMAFAILALVGGIGIKESADRSAGKLYQAQIESCERGNQVRLESNSRIASHIADRDALRDFLLAAKSARVSAYERDQNPSDLEAVRQYGALVERLDNKVTFRPVQPVNCVKVVPKP